MIERTRPEACPSDLLLDAWAAAELDPKVIVQLEKHLSHCEACQERRSGFDRERAEFLAIAPTFDAQRRIAALTAPAARKSSVEQKARGVAAFALGLGAIGLFCVLAMRPWESTPDTRSKGAPHLGLFVKRGKLVTRAASGVEVRAGDLLRFTYSSDLETYLALLSVDASGARAYFPASGSPESDARGQRMHSGTEVALDFSVELDASPGDERILGVFCRTPFEIEPLLQALRGSGALPQVQDCHVDELRLRKQPPR